VVWKFFFISSTAFLLGLGMGLARADEGASLEDAIKAEIAGAYPGAAIEFFGPVRWTRGALPESTSQVRFLGENGRGEAQIQVRGVIDEQGEAAAVVSEGMVPFAAKMPAWVALRRVLPGEKIDPSFFVKKSIDVARGQAREQRGLILPASETLAGLESRQTILEGQFLTTPAIQKAPDLRRGDIVNIRVISGGLTVDLQGTAEESGYLDGHVKVMATKTKRELVGQLKPGSIVEVSL
jgi:flagella basal body P-ring formation protein FlgA